MKLSSLSTPLLAAVLIHGVGCTAVWAQAIADRMSADVLALESYRGRTVETGLVPGDPKAKVVRQVTFKKGWKLRAETLEPASRKGDLFIYDGASVLMWWPNELMGIRVRGLPAPTDDEVKEHIRRQTDGALAAYAYSLRGIETVAGQHGNRWLVLPTHEEPWRMPHEVWMHERYSFPLKVEMNQVPERSWYTFQFDQLVTDTPVELSTFSAELPRNAVVFEWDLGKPGISLEEARASMNFEVRLPKKLPAGHELVKLVEGDHQLPMLVAVMSRGGSWLSLTESRAWSKEPPALGLQVDLGSGRTGYLSFYGANSAVTWVQGNTQLTLIGNLAFPEVLQVAASVE